MCPSVGPHAASFRRQLRGLPSRVEYLSPPGVMLPLVYGRTASLLWLALRGLAAWQATPSWTVYQLACHRLLPWLRMTFAIVPQEKKVGARGRRAVYDVATKHGHVVITNCHVPHGRRVKEYVAQLRLQYVRALERGPVIVVGDFNYDPRRRGAETDVDREVRMFVEETQLQDVSYSGAPGPSHCPAPEGNGPSRIDAVYADPKWVKGATARYMVGPDKPQDTKGHCPMMVTVDMKVG